MQTLTPNILAPGTYDAYDLRESPTTRRARVQILQSLSTQKLVEHCDAVILTQPVPRILKQLVQ